MNVKRWIARREPSWKQLDALLQQVEKRGLRTLSADQVKQLAGLYRSVSADLARAQTRQLGNSLTQQLQQLTLRAYSQVYQKPRHQSWQAIWQFYRWGFPAVVQRTWVYLALSTGIFLLGALIGWWFAWGDPDFVALVAPESLIRKVQEDGELWMGSILLGKEPLGAAQIMTNNLSVTFRTFAGGMVAGVGTVLILFFNGLMLGAIATLVTQNNLAGPFWGFVAPHGAWELPAIFLAGAAGLLIGRALLFPGSYRRGDALKVYGLDAAQLMFGVIPLLFMAGIIEGFFSPSPLIADGFKYIVGGMLLTALVAYCSLPSKIS